MDSVARLDSVRNIMLGEADAIVHTAQTLDQNLLTVVDRIANCAGQVVVSGMGKAGLVGQKLSATFALTGTRSIFLHPSEAVHGDLGESVETMCCYCFPIVAKQKSSIACCPPLSRWPNALSPSLVLPLARWAAPLTMYCS